MNIYERRLRNFGLMLKFLQKIYPQTKIRYWQDIECNRDGTPQRLWTLRHRLGLDIKTFALKIGVSQKKYEEYERIGAKVPESIIKIISKKFHIKKNWIEAKSDYFELSKTESAT